MTVYICLSPSTPKLANYFRSPSQSGLIFICTRVDYMPAQCTSGFGRLYLSVYAKGLLGTLSRPAWSRLCTPGTIGDGFSQQSLVCLGVGNGHQRLAGGPPDQRISEQETLSPHPRAEEAGGRMGPGRRAPLTCLEGPLSFGSTLS